jgi:UDP-glucose 4-epimerase
VRVLVTGGTGFLGRHVVADLLAHGHGVTTLSRSEAPVAWPCPHLPADIIGPAAREATRRAQGIVHLAGLPDVDRSLREPYVVNQTNALGTLNVLEGARGTDAVVVLLSTARLYRPADHPLREDAPLASDNPYAISKRVAEQWAAMYHELYGLATVVLRGFSVYGPGQVARGDSSGVVSILAQLALAGRPLVIDRPTFRDFLHVTDAVRLVRQALTAPAATGGVYNLASGEATPLVELAGRLRSLTGGRSLVHGPPPGPLSGYVADMSRTRAAFAFQPAVPLAEGLQGYLAWLRETFPDLAGKIPLPAGG